MKNKKFLSLGVATLLIGMVLTGCVDQQEVNDNPTEKTPKVDSKEESQLYVSPEVSSADEAMELLVAGNKRYVDGNAENYDLGKDRREVLTKGQKPHTVVVVIGHESCGAVTTAVDKTLNPEGSQTTENIDAFLDNIKPAARNVIDTKPELEGQELVEAVVDLNVEMSLDQLLEDSNLIKTAVDSGKYQLSTGEVTYQK